jgi:hypothetical protein
MSNIDKRSWGEIQKTVTNIVKCFAAWISITKRQRIVKDVW